MDTLGVFRGDLVEFFGQITDGSLVQNAKHSELTIGQGWQFSVWLVQPAVLETLVGILRHDDW
jgi:hypothetical protein